MACVRVCPADAVAVEGAIVRIVDEACTRCGLCLPACPHDAIEAVGDVSRALELALAGRAVLILSVECAVYFYPAAPNQVVNACYAAGFRTVPIGLCEDYPEESTSFDTVRADMEALRALGISHLRVSFPWDSIERWEHRRVRQLK